MKSIIQKQKYCYLCDALHGEWNERSLEEHHIFAGTANRRQSEKYGLKVYLCQDHHRDGKEAAHRSRKSAQLLHEIGQTAFETQHGSRQAFMNIFGRNYL